MSGPRPVPARAVRTETVVDRSRFLCTLEPVADVGSLAAVVAAVRKRFPDARHHCTASVLGEDGAVQRSNDDGEPAGTAGAPMLAALVGAGLYAEHLCTIRKDDDDEQPVGEGPGLATHDH